MFNYISSYSQNLVTSDKLLQFNRWFQIIFSQQIYLSYFVLTLFEYKHFFLIEQHVSKKKPNHYSNTQLWQ